MNHSAPSIAAKQLRERVMAWAISGPEITIVGGLGMHSRNHVVQFQVVRSAASGGASPM